MATSSSEWYGSDPSEFSSKTSAGEMPARQDPTRQNMLNLRVVRGPLQPHENESILSQYNNMASAEIPAHEFLRWIQESPEGPAWHAILEAGNGEIVGHTSLIPFRAAHEGRSLIAAKSEYSFIREEFRASKIKGFEQTGRLKNLIYIDELFRRCRSEGWSPLLISTPSAFHRVFRSIACFPVRFPLWECLLVLRPLQAAQSTPNLRGWQRASLWGAGMVQSAVWAPAAFLFGRNQGLVVSAPDQGAFDPQGSSLSFFQDTRSLTWRYPQGEYERIAACANAVADLIVKKGTGSRYLRVCQWHLNSEPAPALVAKLVQMAREQGALGVRWAVYGDDAASLALVRRLRNLGFLCARRVRTLLVNTADERFLNSGAWNMTDAMFSFDL